MVYLSADKIGCTTTVYVYYAKHTKNWGDKLNKPLVEFISGNEVHCSKQSDKIKYFVIGSILEHMDANSIIWGSGFISKDSNISTKPRKIHAVRGPLTRLKLLEHNIECPEIYGDPALLYPLFYNPNITKTNEIGIIPHYVDRDNEWVISQEQRGIKIIDIKQEINAVVDQIKSCKAVLSSSLHGLIAAESYNIPNYWIRLSNNIIGGNFKYIDYFKSINRNCEEPIIIDRDTKLSSIELDDYKINIDNIINGLKKSCPFWRCNE